MTTETKYLIQDNWADKVIKDFNFNLDYHI